MHIAMSGPFMALPICISSLCGPISSIFILYSYSEAAWLIFETKIWAFMMKLHDEVRKLMTFHAAVAIPIILKEILT